MFDGTSFDASLEENEPVLGKSLDELDSMLRDLLSRSVPPDSIIERFKQRVRLLMEANVDTQRATKLIAYYKMMSRLLGVWQLDSEWIRREYSALYFYLLTRARLESSAEMRLDFLTAKQRLLVLECAQDLSQA